MRKFRISRKKYLVKGKSKTLPSFKDERGMVYERKY